MRNPTMPMAGGATRAAGATRALAAAAIAGVVDALSAVLAINACAVGIAPDSVTVADGCAPVETTLTASTEVADVDEFSSDIAVSAVVECVEFDSVSAGVDVVGSLSGAWVAGGVLGSAGSSVAPTGSLESGGVSTMLVPSSGSVLVDVAPVAT